ncbi:MAG: ketoacyl-ACP synthase III [Deltaproteobacteria bacterium HGW-Deltaproteobacteria-10]|nr:MAG: ketoacyl-ACP synthase III [Deltaproteobacteria bacterium HGW-Deltaproteobacteria-10]
MLYLHSMGHFHPENIISNKFLEDLDIGTTNEWIMERVGIQNRRTVLPLDYIKQTKNANPLDAFAVREYKNAQMGAAAARLALLRAGIKPDDIGMLIAGSSSPDNVTPAEAAAIAAELGIEAPCFDLNAACATFGMNINFLLRMQPETLPPYVLVVNVESMTKTLNYADRSNAVIFGDGAVAAVVSAKIPAPAAFISGGFDSRPSGWTKVGVDWNWTFHQDGNAVQGFAIRTTTECLKLLHDSYAAEASRFIFIGHQANLMVLKNVGDRGGIAPEHQWHNVEQFGNTACCGAPSVLSMQWDDLKPGDNIAMVMVGAGLSWAYMMLQAGGGK